MTNYYKEDLAFIHDVGYRDFVLKSAPGILKIIQQNNINSGLVVDLGCGSGLWAEVLVKTNYQVLGIDISEGMINIAKVRVPTAKFMVESLFKAEFPTCNTVTSISECINYLFDADNNSQTLSNLFQRIYHALNPGGVFVFDIAEPGQVPPGKPIKSFNEGEDWIVLVEKEENREQAILNRRIITLRKVGEYYRRDDEIHVQKLYKSNDIAELLREVGFMVEVMSSYGDYPLPPNHAAFVARKVG
ncbi:class I SAM-dependent methyltransferase [Sphaerospermopsis aphanizomenoides BCCUSP55]|uniref:class I SAM-dependent DNA methyltransferase n=1 Tax=Sphaerospermopsis aphanizomenoides TaxID=459663 RepID=UPI0019086029|nr:class I SAM-dependent methyltransferase [Sphaerospermopsis aphanizomenoides]MBK1987554.1 class I SAM-dependent methyltransferase [Sphaerospermopsis aphanizomenoides BCCUSP55]